MRGTRLAALDEFLVMVLSGRSDVTYRAYDLMHIERKDPTRLKTLFQWIGLQEVNEKRNENSILMEVQAKCKRFGYDVSLGEVESLLRQFYVYYGIKENCRRTKNIPYRDPDEASRMYEREQLLKREKVDASGGKS